MSREFYAPAALAFEDIESAAGAVGSYYGERMDTIAIAERHEGPELQPGTVRLIIAFSFAHDSRDLDSLMCCTLADRLVAGLAPLGLRTT